MRAARTAGLAGGEWALAPATLSLAGFRDLPALEGASPVVQRMLEVEAVQLLEGAGELREGLERPQPGERSGMALQHAVDVLQELGGASAAFRQVSVPA